MTYDDRQTDRQTDRQCKLKFSAGSLVWGFASIIMMDLMQCIELAIAY